MASSTARARTTPFEFGPFRFDTDAGTLHRGPEFVPLTPKMSQCLALLLEEAGQLVSKEQLLERVWPGVVVEEGAIANNISALLKVLAAGFDGEAPIATVARRGYRFTAEVRRAAGNAERVVEAAKPAIAERGTVLICDFDNRTGDAIFDATLRQALALHLAQSPYLEVVGDRKAHALLGVMGRTGEPLLGDVALEVCARAGAAAAIVGTIMVLGDEYVLGLQAMRSTGEILETQHERARGKGEVLGALDRAAIELRTKLGESRLSVTQFGVPVDELATTSLEALKAYATGRDIWFTHGEVAAKPHQLRAIELDPQFASAYSMLAISCDNMGQTEEARAYMQKAYDLRGRSTELERMRLEGQYHMMVTGDRHKALDAYRAWAQLRTTDANASGNTGWLLQVLGQWEPALEWQQRGMALELNNITANNLVLCLMAVGRINEARGVLEDVFARGPCPFYLHLDAYLIAFLRGDRDEMARQVANAGAKGGEEDFLIAAQADTAAFEGDHEQARALTRRAVESARRADSLEMAACWEVVGAIREAELGNLEFARERTRAALAMSSGRILQSMAAYVLARCGDAAAALALADRLDAEYPQDTLIQRYWMPCMHAAIALGRKDWKAAIDALEAARAIELAISQPFEYSMMLPVWLRSLALQGAGKSAEAARERAKITQRPGLVKNFLTFALAR